MRTKWRRLTGAERAAVAAALVLAFIPFLLLQRVATLAAALAAYLALLPVLVAGLISLYSGLRLRKKVMGRRVTRAMRKGELVLHYQPQIGLHGGITGSVEALVRWSHPKDGLVPPGVFLPALEDTRLARQLDLHVLDLALAEAADWQRAGRSFTVAVNFSPTSLLEPPLADDMRAALQAHGLSPQCLELEITELGFDDGPALQRALDRVKAVGVRIALDDFGVGHSSLARLVTLPVDRLKIDRSFVAAMTTDRRADSVVRAAIDVAHDLDVQVVAEGVEDHTTLQRLLSLGCDLAQGYLFSPPVPAERLAERVEHVADLLGDHHGLRAPL